MEKIRLTKEIYDFLNGSSLVATTVEGKKYMHLPMVFEVINGASNLVEIHYNDKKLPEEVKNILIENAICKSVKK